MLLPSASGGMDPSATTVYKKLTSKLASMLAYKWAVNYNMYVVNACFGLDV